MGAFVQKYGDEAKDFRRVYAALKLYSERDPATSMVKLIYSFFFLRGHRVLIYKYTEFFRIRSLWKSGLSGLLQSRECVGAYEASR